MPAVPATGAHTTLHGRQRKGAAFTARCYDSPVPRSRSLTALLVLLTWTSPRPSSAAPTQVRLAYAEDAATGVQIAWNSKRGPAEAQVRYGTRPDDLSRTATGKTARIGRTLGWVSEVTLAGLSPATTYTYRVGGPKGGWSPAYTFRTGPPDHPRCGRARFAVLGDSRANRWPTDHGASDLWPMLMALAMGHRPAFFLHTGDIVRDARNHRHWDQHLAVTVPFSQRLPIMYSIGNHDDGPGEGEGALYNRVLHLPRASRSLGGSGTEDYYFFTHGNAIFVALSTCTYVGGHPRFAEQAAFLDRVLARHPKRWKFVYLHHPIYTRYLWVNHRPNEERQNAALVPVINRHQVDIVFQGHNHVYERFAPSACARGASGTPCPVSGSRRGTVYITTGGGGALLHPVVGSADETRPAAAVAYHYVLVEVADHTLTLTAHDLTDRVIDRLRIAKRPEGPRCPGAPADPPPSAPRSNARSAARPSSCACSLAGPGAILPLLALLAVRRRKPQLF
jgi:hypothetical protein